MSSSIIEERFPRPIKDQPGGALPQCGCGRLMEFRTLYDDIRPIEGRYFFRVMEKFYCECGTEVGIVRLEESKEISAKAFKLITEYRENYRKWDGDTRYFDDLPDNWDEL